MCMTFVIGKNASRTGRVIIGHNEDDAGHTVVRHGYVPAKDWPEGALVPAEEGRARIPQASHTFGYHWSELAGPEGGYPWGDGFLNECGVCVTSNNCNGSKEDNPDLTDGGIAYNLRRVLAERYMPVTAGSPLALLSAGGQEIVCMAAEKDARMVRVGMQARLSVDGAEAGKARVEGVGPVTADSATGRPQVEITLVPDAPLALPQGAAVAADVVLTGAWDVPVLPLEAVTDRGTVWWVHDGICTEIPVEIVLSDEKHAWVNLPEGTAVAIGEFEEGQPILEAAP
jgi:hypothetical protein